MEIKIICVGKIKNHHLSALINDYINKIIHFCKINIIEIPEVTFSQENKQTIALSLKQEQSKIEKYMKDSFNIVLGIEGKSLDSKSFAQKILTWTTHNSKNINFIIGSSYGLGNEIKNKANFVCSFSTMTYPHQLMRLILLEQIYRAFTINHKINYHK